MENANALGTIVDARYQLVELLGEGGSGSTYKATRLADGATVALKILSLRHLNDWKQLELFEREAKVLAQLNHPQIPDYLEYFHVDTPSNRAFYIVQQLAPGKPLTAWVQSGWRGTEAEVRDIASQLLGILQYLHQQSPPLIHRDLKPHNIIRNDDGRVFLVDFGSVQDVYHNTLLKGSTVAGTFGYMAPEQFRGAAVPASDLYGLGATILYLLTHRSPADLPQARLKLSFRAHVNISNQFADWLETMLEPDTADRFSSAAAALATLQTPNRFRSPRGTKVSFPWQGVAVAATVLAIFVPLIYEYRYTFITRLGFPARDICDAIGRNDIRSVREHLDRGVSVNANVVIRDGESDPDRAFESGSLLHCAIGRRQVEIVKYLLDNGANLDSFNSNGLTPLHQAINLHTYCPTIENENDRDCHRQIQIATYLLDLEVDINIKARHGLTPLMFAVRTQNAQAVRYLLKHGADPHALFDPGSYIDKKYSLWHILATNEGEFSKSETESIAQQLILAKVDIDRASSEGNTPLHLAIDRLNSKAPLHLEIDRLNSKAELIKLLLANGAKTDRRNNRDETPLTEAILRHDSVAIKLLLSRNSGINIPDKNGKTPLMTAIKAAPPDANIVKLLLAKGANPNLADGNGTTALHLLGNIYEGRTCQPLQSRIISILDLLIEYQADIKAIDKDGNTALHILAANDLTAVVDRLIGYGGNPRQKNHQGLNAMKLLNIASSRWSKCP